MRTCAGQGQHQNIVFNPVDQQPIRLNVTFPMPYPITRQIMVLLILSERFSCRQQLDGVFQQLNFKATLYFPLIVLLELCSKFHSIFEFFHAFKSLNNSSRSLYPFTAGSFAILSASIMAAIVSLFGFSNLISKGIPPSRSD